MPNYHCANDSNFPCATRLVEAIELATPQQLSLFGPIQTSIQDREPYIVTCHGCIGKSVGIARLDAPPPA